MVKRVYFDAMCFISVHIVNELALDSSSEVGGKFTSLQHVSFKLADYMAEGLVFLILDPVLNSDERSRAFESRLHL